MTRKVWQEQPIQPGKNSLVTVRSNVLGKAMTVEVQVVEFRAGHLTGAAVAVKGPVTRRRKPESSCVNDTPSKVLAHSTPGVEYNRKDRFALQSTLLKLP